MIAAGDSIFVDTNVLLTATTPARRLHAEARCVLETWPERGFELCVSGQVVREYLAVSTRPIAGNGLGLTITQALDNTRQLLGRLRLLEESRAVTAKLLSLLGSDQALGKQVHDANIVATLLAHGLSQLLTDNVRDFARFSEIALADLAEVQL